MGTLVASVQSSKLTDLLSGDSDVSRVERLLSESEAGQQQALAELSPKALDQAAEALTSAVASTYWLAAGLLAVTFVIAVAILRRVRAVDAVDEPPDARHPAT
jgi:DNA-binding MurR/RpiR family transcriptional regulator